jgi:hypothetical protein
MRSLVLSWSALRGHGVQEDLKGLRPAEIGASKWPLFHCQPHRNRGRMPARSSEAFKWRLLGGE